MGVFRIATWSQTLRNTMLVLSLLGLLFFQTNLANAQDAGSVAGYSADVQIDYGTIVELTGEKSDRVKVATQAKSQNMFGVVVDPQVMPVKISSADLENETFVAVSGTHRTLVSTQNGAIQSGDYLMMSSINGVAMKAGTEKATVFGRAVSGFDGEGVVLGQTVLKDENNHEAKTVKLGAVQVIIDIKSNPNDKSTKTKVPEILQRIGQAIAEKEVSPIRIYLSMAITTISLITALGVIFIGVRNSIISIGRNPMSKKSIFRALLEIIFTSVLILIIGLFAVYLLLRL